MKKIKKIGRPSQNDDKRGQLLMAAKKLFVLYEYDKVSIRSIASEANVDSALIRYYFQSKLGLFTAMIQETAAPMTSQLESLYQSVDNDSPSDLMTTYYRVMSQNPDFPKLIFKIALMPQSNKNQVLKQILNDTLDLQNMKLFHLMQEKGLLQENADPLCTQLSFFSMMIFPFLMPDFLKQALKIEITPEFMTHLAMQNSQLLQHGCINTNANKERS